MGDGEVNNEFDIFFSSLSTRGHDADEHDASPNPHASAEDKSSDSLTHTRSPREVSERQRQQRVLFINGAREVTNEA